MIVSAVRQANMEYTVAMACHMCDTAIQVTYGQSRKNFQQHLRWHQAQMDARTILHEQTYYAPSPEHENQLVHNPNLSNKPN
jgi:hypothetical protein